jgi:hypothetical protein
MKDDKKEYEKWNVKFLNKINIELVILLRYEVLVLMINNKWSIIVLQLTLESGIDVGQWINVGLGKFGKKNKRRALNKRRAWQICQKE